MRQKHLWKRLLLADLLWFASAALIALAAGVAGDQLLRCPPLGLRYKTAAQRILTAPSVQERASINLVTLEEMVPLLEKSGVIALDARPRVFYELGHLPGARSLSREQFDLDFALLEKALRGHSLLVYCSDAGCEDSAVVARALQERGFGPLLLFAGGIDEWEAAGKPLEAVP